MTNQDKNNNINNNYDESDIQVLEVWKPLEAAWYVYRQHRYSRLHHLVYEIVDNSMDEALAGFCDRIHVIIHKICLSVLLITAEVYL